MMTSMKRFPTRVDLTMKIRTEMIPLLNRQLADTLDLQSQTKQAHWNVKGAQSHALHELFDRLTGELAGFADVIAERATALGGLALGTIRSVARDSRLPELEHDVTDGMPVVDGLAMRYAAGPRQ
jgi:starvation-inducible DNA-binding protein